MTNLAPAVTLGQAVTYTSTKGHKKMALVIATPESITEGTSMEELNPGFLHLQVFSPSGTISPRRSVPYIEVAKEIPDFAAGEDGIVKGVWSL